MLGMDSDSPGCPGLLDHPVPPVVFQDHPEGEVLSSQGISILRQSLGEHAAVLGSLLPGGQPSSFAADPLRI